MSVNFPFAKYENDDPSFPSWYALNRVTTSLISCGIRHSSPARALDHSMQPYARRSSVPEL